MIHWDFNMSVTWYSLLPPLLAITIAIWRRDIIVALLVSLWLAETLLTGLNPFLGLIALFERVVDVFSDPDRTRVLLFSLLVGALLALFRASGGVNAFVHQLTEYWLCHNQTPRSLITQYYRDLDFY